MQGSTEGAGRPSAAEPTESKRFNWNGPLFVGLIVALIGVAGAVAAALISPSSGGPAHSGPLPPGSYATTYDRRADGALVVGAVGTVQNLPTSWAIYAMARPAGQQQASRTTSQASSSSGNEWFVSLPAYPDAHGTWKAQIVIYPPVRSLTVKVVEGGDANFATLA